MDLPRSPEQSRRHVVWEQYQQEQQNDETRVQEHRDRMIAYRGKSMKYYAVTKGEKPDGGYPLYIALHGGGGEAAEYNDGAWQRMQANYVRNIGQGIYLAPRGITDTWDMHFQPESYILYDRLIENMILFEPVNPDKIYLLGYSAGGDGVYQIAPRMVDRWAAANMSAGHPNSVDMRNLASMPIALQVGQNDELYNRHLETAKMDHNLHLLAEDIPRSYLHTTWIHVGKGHKIPDNDPDELLNSVLVDPYKWLSVGFSDTTEANTNAVSWLSQFVRNPRPERVFWDLKTRADRRGEGLWHHGGHGQQHYWIDIGDHTAETLGVDTIIVALDKTHNMITVERAGKYLRLLLDTEMLNLDEPVKIVVDGETHTMLVRPTPNVSIETVKQRGDPRYIFDASITLIRTSEGAYVVLAE